MTPELYEELERIAQRCNQSTRREDRVVAGILYTVLATTHDGFAERLLSICAQISREQIAANNRSN